MLTANTNPAAHVALRSFNSIGRGLDAIDKRVSTGLRVAGALDDASNFSIAQGIRTNVRAWESVKQSLGTTQGLLKVTIAAATAISDMMASLKQKAIEYANADTPQRVILQNDINAILDQIDQMADSAKFNGTNLIERDGTGVTPPAPPDEGTNFQFNGPGSNTHAIGSVAGTFRLNFTATGSGGGNVRVFYNGSQVANNPVNPPNQSGVLTFAFPATPSTDITVQLSGSPNLILDYNFAMDFSTGQGTAGEYHALKDPDGSTIDLQFRSMRSDGLDIRPLDLTDVTISLAQIAAAEQEVNEALGYYAAKLRETNQARLGAEEFIDSMNEGLGNIVDANIARESSRRIAEQARLSLSQQTLSLANRKPEAVLTLFNRN
ncbi:MAG: flagellin [Rhodospirillaceae bacterium]|jgi:flagellin-like hook-associated protein FlgL|nr:flagellin [Rhodospirillaceae bacterium]MBT6136691.1 flagellin [Rhodospirillaceae bacterium]